MSHVRYSDLACSDNVADESDHTDPLSKATRTPSRFCFSCHAPRLPPAARAARGRQLRPLSMMGLGAR